jgi:hypothetical protein
MPLTVEAPVLPWHNAANPLDVNADGVVSPLDVLLIINRLNLGEGGELSLEGGGPPFLDVTGNNMLTPLDALLIINHLNAAEGDFGPEGEDRSLAAVGIGPFVENRFPAPFATFRHDVPEPRRIELATLPAALLGVPTADWGTLHSTTPTFDDALKNNGFQRLPEGLEEILNDISDDVAEAWHSNVGALSV